MIVENTDVAYSVIIPTSNHPELLQRCLTTLSQVRSPTKGWEVLVVDNSTDALKADNLRVVSSFQEPHFHYHPMPSLGLMAARHRGVDAARGEIIGFIDDDSFVADTWLEGVEASFSESNVVLVGGPNRPAYETQPPAWLEYFWVTTNEGRRMGTLSLLDFGDKVQEIPTIYVFGCNYIIRKSIFFKVGGSHPDYMPPQQQCYQGDGETALSVKVAALGYKARYDPQCAIRHLVPASRMTSDYFGNRAFFTGLHCSFTNFRREYGLGPLQGVPYSPQTNIPAAFRRVHVWARKIKRRLFRSSSNKLREPDDVVKLRQYLEKCYQDGWNFHRNEIQKRTSLREYVLRPDFMGENAKIPER